MRKILLVGGGGHCKSVIDSLIATNNAYDEVGIIDVKEKVGTSIMDIEIIGTDDELELLHKKGYQYAFVTLGSVGNPSARLKIYNKLKKIGFSIPTIIDGTSIIANDVIVGEGSYVGKRAVVNAGTRIGSCTIVNTAAVIEHDCFVGDFVHVAPGSVICGGTNIHKYSHIGANATIIQGITVGTNTIIGAGSTIIRDVDDYNTIVGSPGRVIK